MDHSDQINQNRDFSQFLGIINKRKWLLILLSLSALLSGFFLPYMFSDKFKASALILVRPQKPIRFSNISNKELLNVPVSQTASVETPGKTYSEMITSFSVLEKVVRILELDKKKETDSEEIFLGWTKTDFKNYLKDVAQILKYGKIFKENKFLKTVEMLQENMELTTTTDTYVFSISFKSDDPELAAQVVNTAVEVFIEFNANITQKEFRQTREFMENKMITTRSELIKAKEILEQFKEKNNVFSISDEYKEKLRIISDLETDWETNEVTLVGYLKKFPPTNPEVKSLIAKKEYLLSTIQKRKIELENFPYLDEQIDLLESKIDETQKIYDFISKEYNEAYLREFKKSPEIKLVSSAIPPNFPTKPTHLIFSGLSFFTALIIGIFFILFYEYIGTTIKSVEAVNRSLDLPILATIPSLSIKS